MNKLPKVQRTTLDTKEAAEYLGVHVDTVRRWVHKEGLPVLKLAGGRKWLFKIEYIDKWMEKKMDIDQQFEEKFEEDYGKLRVLKA
ncbi:helix-turn-helix domain-containing protein [Alkalihalobacterium alkalinitrilicum]|uniref:helix-turn-helix domain-containing protein n=1 Tax=Alkalihalobacterium alkalinitrilicum TaxID=427920 RepID=UPI001154F42A|nr:helix-turn-helix domain-containing protein [Alkalihalobacterium alkalinitrilicum]